MKDWRGVEVRVGDTVLYCVRRGSSMGMVQAIVQSIEDDLAKVRIIRRTGSPSKDTVRVSNKHLTVVILPISDVPSMKDIRTYEAMRRHNEYMNRVYPERIV